MMQIGVFALPLAIVLIIGTGLVRRVPVFDVFVEGAKDGLQTAVRILPALIALITAVGMLRASGGLEFICSLLEPFGKLMGFPMEVLPLAMIRPISGSGATALFNDILKSTGADSFAGRVASVMMGSTETTFYTVALYYGAANIRDTRHTIPAALSADFTGFLLSALFVRLLFYS